MFRLSKKIIHSKPFNNAELNISQARIAKAMVHELKNKLTAIDISLAQLQECLDPGNCNEKVPFLLSMIQRSSFKMNEVLLNFYQSSVQEELNLAKIDVKNFIDDIISYLEKEITRPGIFISERVMEQDCIVDIDKAKLQKAIVAMAYNAVDALKPKNGGCIIFGTFKTGDGHCCIYIADNGTGIESDLLDNIFEPFFTTKQKANGLGLTYAQKIITQHKGYVYAESILNEGTAFYLTLPCYYKPAVIGNTPVAEDIIPELGRV